MLLLSRTVAMVAVAAALGGWMGRLEAAEGTEAKAPVTSFAQLWQLPAGGAQRWHPVSLTYTVYYYDPLWQAMWGRDDTSTSFLSLGATTFPIKPGQRIRVEGEMVPTGEMNVRGAKVTILAENVPLEVLDTKGVLGDGQRFDKRLVWMEGYVDRQTLRDPNHLELRLVVDGRLVLAEVLLPSDVPAPQLKDSFVRAKGVFFAQPEVPGAARRWELWVASPADVVVLGSIERDPRFDAPVTPVAALGEVPPGGLAHVAGTIVGWREGESLAIKDETGVVQLATRQTGAWREGDEVEAFGFPERAEGRPVLREAIFRHTQKVITQLRQFWDLPDSERQKRHRARFEFVVYYYDPIWHVLWGRSGDREEYLAVDSETLPMRSGQKVLIEGSMPPGSEAVVENTRVTVLEDSVAIPVVSTAGAVADVARFAKKMVYLEAYVDRQSRVDPLHAQLDLVAEGRNVIGRVLVTGGAPVPAWEGAKVRLRGVYSATVDPNGALPTIEVWVPSLDDVTVTGSLEKEPQFAQPVVPIEKLGNLAPGSVARIEGIARAQQLGKSLTVRDDTGQITIYSAQSRAVAVGERVEAAGEVANENAQLVLKKALYRRSVAAPLPAVRQLTTLRLADQLRELSPEEAGGSFPVHLSGVVTWAQLGAEFVFLRDVSGGVCVYLPPGEKSALVVGRRVEVTGVSALGRFTPVVFATSLASSGTVDLPEPRPVTLEQALTGIEEAQWVSMSGYVRDMAAVENGVRLELTTTAGMFQAMLPADGNWEKLRGSVVRLRGVCSALTNNKRQLTGIQLWVAAPRFVEIEEEAPADPFSVPTRSLASLRQFGSFQGMNHRLRVSGVLVHQEPGRALHIQDGNECLMVLSRETAPLAPGDRVEAVGFPGRESSRVVLREAVYRKVGSGREPAPTPIAKVATIDPELDGRLVRLEAQLLDVNEHDRSVELVAQLDSEVFTAELSGPERARGGQWVSGSRIALTGVYEIEFDEYRRPRDVRILLRAPQDVEILRRPPWWTVKRVLAVAGVFAVLGLLVFGWALALRRRVHEQTGVISEQIEKEKAARLEAAIARASKLESLGVLAGGIAHDFNNLLTVILGNISLAKLDTHIEPDTALCLTESERAAARARDLTQQLLTFAKGGVPVREATRLPDIVREAAQFASHGSKVRNEFDIAPDLWSADVDKGQIGQVVHNIIINATQAMPAGGLVRITLRNDEVGADRAGLAAGRYVRMSFADSGSGISPDTLPRIFEPYFTTKKQGSGLGLATVYSIVKKHDGQIEVDSVVGQGTTFHIWLPAAKDQPAAPAPAEVAAPTPRATAARVLLMDDEAPIRLMAGTVLKRMGFSVTAVGDGAQALSEYAAARAAGRPYDLVILDLTVPGAMGGAEAMERLRTMDPHVRAVVSSGYSSDPIMANYRAHGFRGRAPKPYTASDLKEVIEEVMHEAPPPV